METTTTTTQEAAQFVLDDTGWTNDNGDRADLYLRVRTENLTVLLRVTSVGSAGRCNMLANDTRSQFVWKYGYAPSNPAPRSPPRQISTNGSMRLSPPRAFGPGRCAHSQTPCASPRRPRCG